MMSNPRGKDLILRKPLISSSRVHNGAYQDGTLGKAYQTYMTSHGFDADDRSRVRFIEDPGTVLILE